MKITILFLFLAVVQSQGSKERISDWRDAVISSEINGNVIETHMFLNAKQIPCLEVKVNKRKVALHLDQIKEMASIRLRSYAIIFAEFKNRKPEDTLSFRIIFDYGVGIYNPVEKTYESSTLEFYFKNGSQTHSEITEQQPDGSQIVYAISNQGKRIERGTISTLK